MFLQVCLQPGKAQKQTTSTYYTCTMHPKVKSPKPGNCPYCGMVLVKNGYKKDTCKTNNADTSKQEMADKNTMDSMQVQDHKHDMKDMQNDTTVYTCPMHP